MKDLKTGEIKNLDFFGAFSQLLEDSISVSLNPMAIIFPKIAELKLGTAEKTNTRNCDEIMRALGKYCSSQKDENSLYHQLINSGLADHK